MGTGACLLEKESDMPCGLIIEKVNGIPCEKRLTKDESFADVRYLLEMCRQVSPPPEKKENNNTTPFGVVLALSLVIC